MLLGSAFHWEGVIYLKAGHIALFHSPWAQEYQEMTCLLIGENEMECMVE